MRSYRTTKIVLLVTSAFGGIGGIESFNRALIRALDELAARYDWTIHVQALLDCDDSSHKSSLRHTTIKGFPGRRVRFSLSSLSASVGADLVIIGHVNLAPLAALMNVTSKCLITHGIEVWKKLPRLKHYVITRMNRILAVSAFTQRKMMELNDLTEGSFCVFPNTLDPVAASHGSNLNRSALDLPPGHMLLSVSRLAASETFKNIRMVIESMPAVLARQPDTFYVVVGEGSQRKIFEDLAIKMGLTDRVFLPGAVSDEILSSYYERTVTFCPP